MSDEEKISDWPQVRLDPDLRERIEKIKVDAKDRRSVTKLVNSLVGECLAQIQSSEPSPPAMITLHGLRHALGNDRFDPNYDDLESRVGRLEEAQRQSQSQKQGGKKS